MSATRSPSAARVAVASREARARIDGLEVALCEPLAIIGMACRFPGGATDPALLWEHVCARGDAVAKIPSSRFDVESFREASGVASIATREAAMLDDIDRFDAHFFGVSPREAAQMDPQQRMLLEVAWEALDDAGQVPERLRGSSTGVFAALYNHDFLRYQHADIDKLVAYTTTGTTPAIAAGRISFLLDLRGPALVVDTACSSSLVATHLACASLRSRECDLAIVGGAGLILGPETFVSMSKWGMLAPDGRCKTFDAKANGFGRGEGCGVMVVKRLADALRDGDRVRSVIRGSALNQDGRSTDLTAPNGLAQQDVIRRALQNSQVAPRDVTFIEAHGTGTSLGDPIEVEALAEVLGAPGPETVPCALSSVKSNIGHLEAAAGVAGLIKATLALENAAIPPQALYESPNPHLTLEGTRFFVATELVPWPRGAAPRFAGVSSFGFSGTNAHVVLEEAPRLPSGAQSAAGRDQLLVITARDPDSLQQLAARHADALDKANASIADVCFTAATRRAHYEHRLAVVGSSSQQLAERLRAFGRDERTPGLASGLRIRGADLRPIFVFSGQGPQSPRMGMELFESEPVFRMALEDCDAALRRHSSLRLLDELAAPEGASRMMSTELAQPAIFGIQTALAALWRSWGITPAAVIGHSIGEVAAAHACGILSLDDAARLVTHRGRLMQRATGSGRMASIELPAAEIEALLAGGDVSIAAINSPDSCVVSGAPEAVEGVLRTVTGRGGAWTMLPVDYAFHSAQMDPFCEELEASIRSISPAKATVPMISTVTAAFVAGSDLDAGYWRRNMREPVRFAAAIATLVARGHAQFLEVAPHPVLSQAVQRCATDDCRLTTVASLRRGQPQRATMLQALGAFFTNGVEPAWSALYPGGGRVVSLPRYAWKDERYPVPRYSDVVAAASRRRPDGEPPMLGVRVPLAVSSRVYERQLSLEEMGFLRDHRIGGRIVLPAACFVEQALEFAGALWGDVPCSVEGITFDQPLLLVEDVAAVVQLIAEEAGDDRYSFRICSRTGAVAPWTMHATGYVVRGGSPEPAAGDDVHWLDGQVGDRGLERDAFYDALAAIGPEFGPAFRSVERVRLGTDECWAEIRPAVAASVAPAAFRFHPALLDACFQAVAGALGSFGSGQDDGSVYVPVGIDRLSLDASPVRPARVRARAVQKGGDSATIDISISSEGGRRVATIGGLRARRVPRSLFAHAVDGDRDSWLHEVAWRPKALASAAHSRHDPWIIVDEGTVMGAELAAALGRHGIAATRVKSGAALDLSGRCAGIVYLAAPHARIDDAWSADAVQGAALELCREATRIAQSAIRASHPPRLVVVTRGAQVVGNHPVVEAFAQAALWGWRNTLALEHPELRPLAADLDPDRRGDDVEPLVSELLAEDGEDRVAWRAGARLVARLARATPVSRPTEDGTATRLRVTESGVLDKLAIGPELRRAPGAGEVEIRVLAAGLNFRDVMNALGTYPGDAGQLGDECAGVVVAVGAGVTHVRVGDPVMAFMSGTFATFVTGPAAMVVRKPRTLSVEQAAGVPIVFLTAALALERIAQLRAGQRVLIHAGAGGVGLAAIQIALRAGAEVFATAGSEEKRRYLAVLGVHHVMDSRSLAFADEVRRLTDGEGVDVLLNSLAGEFIAASVAIVRQGGHFLEIGKTGIWTAAQVEKARPGINYSIVFLGRDREERPEVVTTLITDLAARFERGDLVAQPVRVFPYEQPVDAFRYMAQARHIGKIVLRMPGPIPVEIRPDASYLVTGGCGGIGRVVASTLQRAGAKSLVLVGRSEPTDEARAGIVALETAGTRVTLVRGDVADAADVARLAEVLRSLPPLAGILHVAGVIDDTAFTALDDSRWDAVLAPKVAGTWNLHRLTMAMPVDFFVCFSGGAAVLGSAGQANYTAANGAMDAMASYRQATGRPALSIQWGGWSEAGMIARLPEHDRARWESKGMTLITSQQGGDRLDALLGWSGPVVAVLPANWPTYASTIPAGARALLTDLCGAGDSAGAGRQAAPALSESLQQTLRSVPARRRPEVLRARVDELARRILGVGTSHELPVDQPLRDLGLDSLMAVELRNSIGAAAGRALPATLLFDYPSIGALAAHLLGVLGVAASADEAAAQLARTLESGDEARALADMSEAEAEALLIAELGDGGATSTDG